MFDFANNIGLVGREKRYSASELASASLLSVLCRRSARGLGGPESGTQFDFETGCACCGTGARQISELIIAGKLPEQPGLIETETGEWLLSQELVGSLNETLSGVEIRAVRNKRTGNPVAWVQLLPKSTLPPFAPTTRGITIDRQCQCCSRDGHFDTVAEPFEPHYTAGVCADEADAMLTWEHFGLSRLRTPRSDTVLARPRLVISSRLFRRIRSQSIRGLEFIPVTCDDAMPAIPRDRHGDAQ